MLLFLAFVGFLPLTYSQDCTCGQKNSGRIVGGDETAPNEYPWQAALTIYGYQFCGGSLISEQWVVTAAHCVTGISRRRLRILLGEHDKSTVDSITERHRVRSIKIHPNYNSISLENDIALIMLRNPVTFKNEILPVCLPFLAPDAITDGDIVTVTGWGATSSGGYGTDVLNDVDVSYISTETCQESPYDYGNEVTSAMICAADIDKDSCQGDSGGPLIKVDDNGNSQLFGIVSWGYGCADALYPGVYTKVVNYLDWIEDTTGAFFCKV